MSQQISRCPVFLINLQVPNGWFSKYAPCIQDTLAMYFQGALYNKYNNSSINSEAMLQKKNSILSEPHCWSYSLYTRNTTNLLACVIHWCGCRSLGCGVATESMRGATIFIRSITTVIQLITPPPEGYAMSIITSEHKFWTLFFCCRNGGCGGSGSDGTVGFIWSIITVSFSITLPIPSKKIVKCRVW